MTASTRAQGQHSTGQAWLLAFRILGLCSFVLLGTPAAIAQTNVDSDITTNTTWAASQGPYVVTANISIRGGATLTIQAGTTIYMAAGTGLLVNGAQIDARGTRESPITVESNAALTGTPAPGDWDHWVIGSGATATLEHMVLRHGKGLRIEGSSPILNYVVLENHAGPAISVDLAASPVGVGVQASGNLINGILVPAGDIAGTVRWGVRGIPYVVSDGVVSVGASPRIDSVVPSSLQAGETIEVTVSGARLSGIASVSISDANVTAEVLPGATDTSVQVSVTADASTEAGAKDLTLLVDAGHATKSMALTVAEAVPRIDAVAPTQVYSTLGDRQISITGINFLESTVVELDGVSVSTTFVSETRLDAVIPDPVAAGNRVLRLRTPNPSGSGEPLISNEATLSVVQPHGDADPAQPSMFDGGSSSVTVSLPFAAPAGGLDFTITSSAPAVAYGPGTITVPEGQSTVMFAVQAAGIGQAVLTISRSGWNDLTVPVTVVEPPRTLNLTPIVTPLVGVTVGEGGGSPVQSTFTQLSPGVGVIVGAAAESFSPTVGVVGTEVVLTVVGTGLYAVTSVALEPADGVTITSPSISGDGKQITVSLTIAGDAPQVTRRVVLLQAGGQVPFVNPAKAGFLVTAPIPVLESITPQVVQAGAASAALVARGINLTNIQGVRFEPPEGIATVGALTANTEGTRLDFSVQVDSGALSGPRTVIVVSAAGESSATATAANTIQVAQEVGPTYSTITSPGVGVTVGEPAPSTLALGPIASTIVGVQVGEASTPGTLRLDPVASNIVGVAVGPIASNVSPRAGVIDTQLTLTVSGWGLDAVSGIALAPSDGVTFEALSASGDGGQVSVPITIAPDASLGLRSVVLSTATGTVPFTDLANGSFLVSAPVAELESITPQIVQAGGSTVALTVRGKRMNNLVGVRVEPDDGLAIIGAPTVNAEGTLLQLSVQADAATPSGPHVLIVTTSAGESSAVAAAGNTLQVGQQIGPTYASISSPVVGVEVGQPAPTVLPRLSASSEISVILGPAVTVLSPDGALIGTSGTFVFSGHNLAGVNGTALDTADAAITLGAPVPNTEGTSVTVPFSVGPDAAVQLHRVRLLVDGTSVATEGPDADLWRVQQSPVIESVSPTVLEQGKAYTFEVRGQALRYIERVAFDPADNVVFDSSAAWSTDALGEKISVRLIVAPGAATGPRVVRLHFPGGVTGSSPTSANTINVVNQQ